MRKLFRACLPWLNWKTGLAVVAVLGVALFFDRTLALLGTVPLLAALACLVPCLLPLALLRRNRPTATACNCEDHCQTKVSSKPSR